MPHNLLCFFSCTILSLIPNAQEIWLSSIINKSRQKKDSQIRIFDGPITFPTERSKLDCTRKIYYGMCLETRLYKAVCVVFPLSFHMLKHHFSLLIPWDKNKLTWSRRWNAKFFFRLLNIFYIKKTVCNQKVKFMIHPAIYQLNLRYYFPYFMLIDKCRFVNLTDVHIIN